MVSGRRSTLMLPTPIANQALRVQIRQSPYLDTFFRDRHVQLTIDSGATGNMIRTSTAVLLKAEIRKTSQSAHQADGSSPLTVVGETRLYFTRDDHELYFEGLVIDNLDVDVLAGIPFMEHNDISVRPAKRLLTIRGYLTYSYGSSSSQNTQHSVRRAHTLRAPATTTIWSGDYIEVNIPNEVSSSDQCFAVEPHLVLPKGGSTPYWPNPDILHSVSNKIRVPNYTVEPLVLKRHDHFCQIRTVNSVDCSHCENDPTANDPFFKKSTVKSDRNHSATVNVDPDNILPPDTKQKFYNTLLEYDEVFNPNFPGYNGKAGKFEAVVNMGPVLPPQRKGRIPQYSRNQLTELQNQFNALEAQGVFKRPEDLGVTVEYLNPSFFG